MEKGPNEEAKIEKEDLTNPQKFTLYIPVFLLYVIVTLWLKMKLQVSYSISHNYDI